MLNHVNIILNGLYSLSSSKLALIFKDLNLIWVIFSGGYCCNRAEGKRNLNRGEINNAMERAEAADAFEIPDSGRNEMKIDLRQSQLGL